MWSRLANRFKEDFLKERIFTWKYRLAMVTCFLVVVAMVGFLGGVVGFYQGTGTYPFTQGNSVLPPDVPSETTSDVVKDFVADDTTVLNEYGIDTNCVEYAFLMKRNTEWNNIPSEVIELDFTDGTGHLILGFPTSDKGWIFIDPASKAEVRPYVGGMCGSWTISGIYKLSWWSTKEPLWDTEGGQ